MFRMFRFLSCWRKYTHLHSLSQRFTSVMLGHSTTGSVEELFAKGTYEDKLLSEAIALVEQDSICSVLMARYGANSQTLERMFWDLMKAGAGAASERRAVHPFCCAFRTLGARIPSSTRLGGNRGSKRRFAWWCSIKTEKALSGCATELSCPLYVFLYDKTTKPANASYRATFVFNNVRVINAGRGFESRPAHQC